eukprot:TRINITY_DN45_c1_g1_i2.p1 TRINITY_DN45_c1_g1~~TRINITY_DN45_c1_g1_i2.p1  ORF type:complete len:124 (+),score=15.45 TRINITY_DN45_c1_g1_i2:2-373(+)
MASSRSARLLLPSGLRLVSQFIHHSKSPGTTFDLVFARGSVVTAGPSHTSKWMQSVDKPSPMELIFQVPPIEVPSDIRVIACEGGPNPRLGHPVEYINVDNSIPTKCKYCGLRYVHACDEHHH